MIAKSDRETIWEKIMRFSPAAIALSLCLAMLSSAGIGKKADDDINPISISLMEQGNAAVKANELEEAVSWYESALAVDPRNRGAYLEMARVVRSKGLNGKAIRFYKEVLEIEPNDQIALTEQAETMLAKGAVDQAKNNLARLKLLCQTNCTAVDKLAVAIDKAGKKPVMQASAVDIKPVAEEPEKADN
ncbi:tetratricopeptide repeat protein [Sphingorhabdus arenilitoris]|uniref:Tetratricopeptide repeat protein n=1 Tax=Sphingorhabdus arenilitoris TaxID=1490041 RepID=A0ABV8RGX3_9SPHN